MFKCLTWKVEVWAQGRVRRDECTVRPMSGQYSEDSEYTLPPTSIPFPKRTSSLDFKINSTRRKGERGPPTKASHNLHLHLHVTLHLRLQLRRTLNFFLVIHDTNRRLWRKDFSNPDKRRNSRMHNIQKCGCCQTSHFNAEGRQTWKC